MSNWLKSFGTETGHNVATLIGTAVFFGKALFFVFFYMWVRWTIPRFRYDQLMNLGWKKLIPLAIFNIIITGAAVLFFEACDHRVVELIPKSYCHAIDKSLKASKQ